ncbi:hypothetical protein D3C73_1253070 [compost metagenome]
MRISATVPSPPAVSMSATTTFRPSAANAWAVARPMPAAAPVTTATWPENVMLIVLSSKRSLWGIVFSSIATAPQARQHYQKAG